MTDSNRMSVQCTWYMYNPMLELNRNSGCLQAGYETEWYFSQGPCYMHVHVVAGTIAWEQCSLGVVLDQKRVPGLDRLGNLWSGSNAGTSIICLSSEH